MKAYLKNYRQSPRKVRLITTLITGKKVKDAEVILSRLIKRGALPIFKLLKSAIANAKTNNKISDVSNFIINARTDKGVVLKRSMPRAMGRAFPIHKHTSNIMLSINDNSSSNKVLKNNKK